MNQDNFDLKKWPIDLSEIDLWSKKALSILDSRLKYNCRLFLPSDISVTKDFSSGKVSSIRKVNEINHDEEGIDIGPDTIQRFSDVILNSKTVIWNYETSSFRR